MIQKVSNSKYDILYLDYTRINLALCKVPDPIDGTQLHDTCSIVPPTFFMKTFTLPTITLFFYVYLNIYLHILYIYNYIYIYI